MRKHIKNFESLDVAKQATLYSPALTKIANKILVSIIDTIDTPMVITGDSLDEIVVEEKILGPEFIDLGLNVLWCECNLDAENPYELGKYYALGDTEGLFEDELEINLPEYCTFTRYAAGDKNMSSSWKNFCYKKDDILIYFNERSLDSIRVGNYKSFTDKNGKYITVKLSSVSDDKSILTACIDSSSFSSDWYEKKEFSKNIPLTDASDIVTIKLGNNYRMPNKKDIRDIVHSCTSQIENIDDKKYIKIIGPNGNSIILPCGGIFTSSWGSYYNPKNEVFLRGRDNVLYAYSSSLYESYLSEYTGCQIRPVKILTFDDTEKVNVKIDGVTVELYKNKTYKEQGYTALYGENTYDSNAGNGWIPRDPETDEWSEYYPAACDVFYTHYDVTYSWCLLGDTLITMADGSKKRIDEIELGDNVLSLNLDNGEQVSRKVIFTDKDANKQAPQWDEWEFSDGTIIKTTHRHEFYNVECGRFMYLDQWNIGEHTYKQDGTTPELVKHTVHDEVVNHYKITLEDSNNYFANDLLTGDRNCKNNIKLV